jgi:demethylmenaquinone methyltransferase/2-methoxy-6-polyprenyl-1,4-benzoquinol methylase
MFGRIAERYDLMNTVMTGGQDVLWRKLAVKLAAPPPNGTILDVGAGTGKVAHELANAMMGGLVIAADFSEPMLRRGKNQLRRQPRGARVAYVAADALTLPFPDASFDSVTTAFTVRNLTSARSGFQEMARVLKPGGKLVCLEITRIDNPIAQRVFGLYFKNVVPLIGRLISGDDTAYRYLPASVDAFLSPQEMAVQMRDSGVARIKRVMLGMGTVTLLAGTKP